MIPLPALAAKNPLATILAAVILVLLIALGYMAVRLKVADATTAAAQSELSSVQSELAMEKVLKDKMSFDIAKQNEELLKWKAEGDKLREQLIRAEGKVQALHQQHKKELAELASQPVPEVCEEAVGWASKEARKLVEGW